MPPGTLRASSVARGYTLLAITLILAALALILAASLQYAYDERRNTTMVRDDARALTIAEAGLERTLAYVAAIAASDVDLDRALDPNLDTQCLPATPSGMFLEGGQADDNLPVFTDGATVAVPPSGHTYKQVPHAGGAYLVRIEDNDDDAMPGLPASTSNHANTGCLEGPQVRQDPVRDRDRTVIVSVIGIYPGTDFGHARARKALRVTVGPGKAAGVLAGGTVDFGGASHVCGPYGDVLATGDVQGGCLCGPGCSSGGPLQACGTGDSCLARAGGSQCTAGNGGAGGTCTANVQVEPPPLVFPWDRRNAPPPCAGSSCTPFYYLRWDTQVSPPRARLFMWNYGGAPAPQGGGAGCGNPGGWPRLCYPGEAALPDCGACWMAIPQAVPAAPDPKKPATDVQLADAPALSNPTPTVIPAGPAQRVWRAVAGPGLPGGLGCEGKAAALYPGPLGSGRGSGELPSVTFELQAQMSNPLPHGLWFVEGNVRVQADSPDCKALPAGWSASLIATGDFLQTARMLTLRPAHPRGFVVLAGRDFAMQSPNAQLWTCGTSAAVMVHEQFQMNGDQHLQAQVVAENGATCSFTVTGPAVQLQGTATLEVSKVPPIGSGRDATALTWSESSY